jgi:hypothetical protein
MSITPKRSKGKILKSIIAAAAFSVCSFAQAGVLNFETPVDIPIFFTTDHVEFGEYWVETYGGTDTSGFVGAIIDGSSTDICTSPLSCPVNNNTNYFAGLDDGYMYFGLNSDGAFKLKSLQASFIGAGLASYPATSGLLVLQGFDLAGNAVTNALQLGLAGPTNGAFNFATYNLGAFGDIDVNFVRVLGYACDSTGSCNRAAGVANFALDNLTTTTVPEPGTWMLFGLGLAGLAYSRRRTA